MQVHTHARAAVATVVAALLVVTVPARPAWAHVQLLETDPANGASVATPLAAVTLTFSEPVKQQFSLIIVTGADNVSYGDGTPRLVDTTLRQAVKPLPAGAVRVAWQTVSADGHPIEGEFEFTNATAPSTAGASGASHTSAAPPRRLPWFAVGGAMAVAILLGAVLWWRRGIRHP